MAMSKKQKRPLESSTSSGEGGVQRHSKRPAPFETNLQNLQINGTAGYFTLDDVRQVVREAMESANSYLIALIDSRIENAINGFIPEIHSLKSAIPELVREGIEHTVSHIKQVERPPPKCTEIADVRNMQLCFKSKLSLPLYTGMKLEGHQGCPIQVELIDANTDHVVTSGPASSAKLDVVVLKGDFNKEDNNTWTLEEFEHSMVKEREGKRPLLSGKLHVNLVDGVGELGDLSFTDNSSWNSSKKFRIGVQVASGFCAGIRVQEAVTEAFTVKDHRGELYKKHHPPAANDEVWRLENIGKDGKYHKRLNKEGIHTVEEFLRSLAGDSKKLRNILGNGMTEKRWSTLIDHANSCCPNKKSYVYYRHDKKNDGVVTNNLCQLKGLIIGGDYYPIEQLSESRQVDADNLVKAASKNWNRVMEFNAESSSTPMLKQLHGNPSDSRLTPLIFPRTQSYGVPRQSLVPVSEDATVGFPNVNHEHSDGIIPESLILSDNTNLTNSSLEQDTNPWNLQETFGNENFHYTEPHESSPLYLPRPSPPFEGGYFMEELWSSSAYDDFGGNIMPENVDMQNLSNNIGVASSSNQHVGRNFRNGNGRGVVCWFKVKAIFRRGFFKRVSERLVELD